MTRYQFNLEIEYLRKSIYFHLLLKEKQLDHANKSATDALKTSSKRVILKISEATGYLIGNKIAEKLQESWKIQQKITQGKVKKNYLEKTYISRTRVKNC